MISILYVDDEPFLLNVGKLYLEENPGFSVDTAHSADAAHDLLMQKKYDCIVSDYQMPKKDGIAFLKQLRSEGSIIPFIIFTGKGREEIVIEAINSGADFYLQKGGAPEPQFAELAHKIRLAVENRTTEIALRKSREQLAKIIEFYPDATVAIDASRKIFIWNRAIEEMTGIAAKDMLGKSDYAYSLPFFGYARPMLMDLFFDPDHEVRAVYTHIQQKGDNYVVEEFCPTLRKGSGAYVWTKTSPLRDSSGHILGAIQCVQDITERRTAEEELIAANQDYRNLLDQIQDVYYRSDVSGRLVVASRSWAGLLGYDDISECIGKNLAEGFYANAEDRKKLLAEIYRDGKVTNYPIDLRRRDGTIVPIATSSHLYYDPDGVVLGIEGILRDITRQKQAEDLLQQKNTDLEAAFEEITATEEELRQQFDLLAKSEQELRESKRRLTDIIDFLPDATFAIDREGRVVAWNRAMEAMTGVAAGDMIGKGDYEYAIPFYGSQRPILIDMIFASPEELERVYTGITREGSSFMAEVPLPRPGGEMRLVWARASPLCDEDGRVVGAIESVRDITGIRKTQDELHKRNEDLSAAFEEITAQGEELRQQFDLLAKSGQELRESKRRLTDIIDFLPDATFAIDRKGKVIAWNRALEVMTGAGAGSMIGKGDHEYAIPFYGSRRPILIDLIFAPDEEIEQSYAGITREGQALMAETPLIKPGGEQRVIWIKAGPLYDETGNLVGAIESVRDITEIRKIQDDLWRRNEELGVACEEITAQGEELQCSLADMTKAQAALMESEQRYNSLFTNNYSVSLIIDPDTGSIVEANAAACRYYGYSRDQITGLGIFDLNHLPKEQVIRDLLKAKEENEKHFHSIHFLAGGEKRNVEIFSGPIRVNNRLLFYSIIHDVTEEYRARTALRESEERLSQIIEFLPDATFAVDIEGRVIAWNRAMSELTGVPAEEMRGKGDHEYAVPIYGKRRPLLIDLVFAPDDDIRKDYSFVRADGDVLTAETPHALLRGKPIVLWIKAVPLYDSQGARIGAIESIRDITEQKMHSDALVQANRKLNLLSSITRHDILNKILAANAYIGFAERGTSPEETADHLLTLQKIIEEIRSQIAFTKLYQDLGVSSPVWQDVRELLSRCGSQAIPLEIDTGRVVIYADPMLPKMFANLMDNTIRHGDHATRVRVSAEERPDGLVLVWEDNGAGISDNEKEMIFERGYGKNTGLGLFFVREMLAITGITVKETGTAGKGARFEITVPKGAYRFGDTGSP